LSITVPESVEVPLTLSAVVVTPANWGEDVVEMFWGSERVTVPVAEETEIWLEVPCSEVTPMLVRVTVPGAEVAIVSPPPFEKV
jgi:hypothetical protein